MKKEKPYKNITQKVCDKFGIETYKEVEEGFEKIHKEMFEEEGHSLNYDPDKIKQFLFDCLEGQKAKFEKELRDTGLRNWVVEEILEKL